MAFVGEHEFILKKRPGVIFNFYLNEQKHIEYIISEKEHGWKEKSTIFNQITEEFCLDIDDNGNIHIISHSEDNCLYYHQFANGEWVNHLIFQYPTGQTIIYPIIKHINGQIHIFYYLLHDEHKNNAYLFHLKFYNGKHDINHIVTVNNHTYVNPFKIFMDNDELILLYASVIKGYEQIFISKLNMSTEQWTGPLCITSSEDKKIYIDGILDNAKILHLIWSRFDEEYLTVRYLNLDVNKITKNSLKSIPLSSESSCSFPVLIYYEKILWAIWTEMGKLVSCYSTDMGENWSQHFYHEDTKKIDFKRYRYLTNCIKDKKNILCDFVFGTLYPHIQFLGFGGENNDEVPTK